MGMTYRNSSVITLSITLTTNMDTGWGYMKLKTNTGAGLMEVMTLSGKKASFFFQ